MFFHLMCEVVNEQALFTSSSLYQDRDSAVRTNQYSFDPPFMMLMLIVSQPFLITCNVRRKYRRYQRLIRHRKEADGWRDKPFPLHSFDM